MLWCFSFFLSYREETARQYAIIFGDREQEPKYYKDEPTINEVETIGSKYGWYAIIHRMAGGDILKINEITKIDINSALNWLSYTKEIELEEERNRQT